MTRAMVSAASAASIATPNWKLPVAVLLMQRLVLSQKIRAHWVMAPW
jgi:hypothetical protein